MKKSIIASVIALGMLGGYAHAGQVIFSGAVTADTCDLVPSVNGSPLPNQVIVLPTVAPGVTGNAVTFAMKPANQAAPGCANLAGKAVTVDWSGSGLGVEGFRADAGSIASDAVVMLTAKNSKTPNTAVNASASTVEFGGDKVTTDGLQFDAKTKGGQQAGNFQSTASFTVAYK